MSSEPAPRPADDGAAAGADGTAGGVGGAGPVRWSLVLPVKGGAGAKSRLVPAPGGEPVRLALALALALDCLDAVLRCPRVADVVVVTSDTGVRAAVAGLLGPGGRAGGVVRSVDDPGAGLDAAAAAGLAAAGTGPRAVLLADLPCLVPEDLTAALDAAADHGSALVPDAGGTGTVLLALARDAARPTRFGAGSAAAHAADGAVRLDLALPRLRRDVDTPAELDEALALGVGPRTRAAMGA